MLVPIGNSIAYPGVVETTNSRPVPMAAGAVGSQLDAPPQNPPASQQPGSYGQTPVAQTSGLSPPPSPAAPGLPPWPGRPPILAPVATDVRADK
jgi:hypothetical protein